MIKMAEFVSVIIKKEWRYRYKQKKVMIITENNNGKDHAKKKLKQ